MSEAQMALTTYFKNTVMELCKDPSYRKSLIIEALEAYLEEDIVTGNTLLRNYLNGCLAFREAEIALNIRESGLRRILSSKGNPSITNFIAIFTFCRKREGLEVDDIINI
ncbi:MAG: hypothetical protein JKY55_17835 [Aliivibrio sp.]|uniref:hypothetical protein n=1 Tax=Aliivibrio sp. TaxID=1872443 RepID=UPI001A5C6A99|nr:hypothetical protein [Aliivibrio sp.]